MAGKPKVKIHESQGGVVPAHILAKWAADGNVRPAFMPTDFQSKILLCPAQEIFVTGEKGSGKSGVSRAFIMKGNVDKPWFDRDNKPILTNQSYLYHPQYFAMVIRKNQEDLRDWMRKFAALARPVYGGRLTEDPWIYTSSYGAQMVGGHMADQSSWQRYTGVEIHRLVWEEIVFIPEQAPYDFIKSVVRSSIPEIRPQILANCNPLGPGVGWLWPYFIETKDEHGETVERSEGVPYVVSSTDTVTGETFTSTRCWFFGRLSDNPYQDTPEYRAALLNQPAYIRDAYYYGKANRRGGSFFDNFRRRPNKDNNEPDNAQHVYPRQELNRSLRKWMPLYAAIDWGFGHEAVITLGQVHPGEKRLYVIDGHGSNNMSTTEVGMQLGRMLQPYLSSQEGTVLVALSPDAFSRESEIESEAKRIYAGLCKVLGPNRAWLEGEDPTQTDPPDDTKVAIVKAFNKRAMGWSMMYELLNYVSNLPKGYDFTQEEAQKIYLDKGAEECNKYYRRWQDSMPQVVPRLLISADIQGLIDAIPKAMRDPKNPDDVVKTHWDGADWVDSLRYLIMLVRFVLGNEPAKHRQQREFTEAVERGDTPYQLLWLNRYQEGQRPPDAQQMLDWLNSPDALCDVNLMLQ